MLHMNMKKMLCDYIPKIKCS